MADKAKKRPWTGSRSFSIKDYDAESFKSFSIKGTQKIDKFGGRSTTMTNHEDPTIASEISRVSSAHLKREIPPPPLKNKNTKITTIRYHELNPLVKVGEDETMAKSQNTLCVELRGRNQVPHDFPVNRFSHVHYCGKAPQGMITNSLAYSSRNRWTTFGKSNRIPFLLQLRQDLGKESVRAPYPPSYHGAGGEGNALGLTMAGSAGNERILGPVFTYGRIDGKELIHRPRGMSELKDGPDESMRAKSKPIIPHQKSTSSDPKSDTSMHEVLMMEDKDRIKARIPRVSPRPLVPQLDKKLTIHTRYSANKEWTRETGRVIQPDSSSHFYISENQRLGNGDLFRDDIAFKQKQRHELKLKNHVRDKNAKINDWLLA